MKHLLLLLYLCLLALIPVQVSGQFQLVSLTSEPAGCYGDYTGSIAVEVSGGTPDYTYALYKGATVIGFVETSLTSHIFSGLNAGSYFLGVIEGGGGGVSGFITVSQPTFLITAISPDPAETCPGSPRQLNGNPSGGTGSLIHEWTGPGTTWLNATNIEDPVFTSGIVGSYDLTYTVTDQNGCSASGNIQVQVLETISAGFTTTDVTCYDGNNGTITVTGSDGGSGSYEYSVNGSEWQSANLLGSLFAGSYEVWIRDALYPDDCRVMIGTALIGQPDIMTAMVSHAGVTCYGGSDGSITIGGATGGSGSYGYRVSGHDWQTDGLFEGLAAGSYVVEIRDASDNDCVIQLHDAYMVPEPEILAASVSHVHVTCPGGSNGSITISSPTGGSGNYMYRITGAGWSNSGLFTGLQAGSYEVLIRDQANSACIVLLDNALVIVEPEAMDAVISHEDVTCFDGSNGSITISDPSGGSGSYQYRVGGSGWQSSGLFEGLPAGTYEVEMRDGADPSCVKMLDGSYIIQEPGVLGALITHDDADCFGSAGGSITISDPSGGSGSYQYRISGSGWQDNALFEGLYAGSYVVEIRDGASTDCIVELDGSYVVSEPDVMQAIISHEDVTCFDGNNGSITISGSSGGSGSYEYRVSGHDWQGGGLFAGLTAGSYVVEIRDGSATGCIIELDGSYAVGQPGIMVATVMHEDVTCQGASDGSISVGDPAGGSGSYQYRVSGAGWQDSGLFEGLADGSYAIEIRDAANPSCVILLDDAYSINGPAALDAAVDFAHVTGCHGDATGWIEIINATGSWAGVTGNYQYSTDGGSSWFSSGLFEDLAAGTYNVQVRDGDNPGCSFIINDNVVLTQPDPVTAVLEVVDVSCYGGSSGSIRFVDVLGGSGIYEYIIQGPVNLSQTTPFFADLPSGTYQALVQNLTEPACPAIINPALVLTQPGELSGTVSKTDVSGCSGDSNGEIEITDLAGGSGNYQFSADNGATWQDNNYFGGLPAGTYMVWIRDRDEVSCTMFLGNAEILQPEELYAGLEVTDAGCFNGSDGSILVTSAAGGSGNWEFSIDGVSWQEAQLFSALSAGDYTVLMRDRDFPLCEISPGLVTVGQPEIISLDIISVTGNECFGAENGSITALASGGTPGYTYSLYHGGALVESLQPVHPASAVFSALTSGNDYRIAVTDFRGCDPAEIAAIVVTEPAEVEISSVVPVHVDCYGEESGSITVVASGGTGQLLFSINGVDFLDNGGVFENLPSGLFDVSVMDGNGCRTDYGQVEINSPSMLSAQVDATDITCFGLNDGTIEILNPQGGTMGNYEYSTDGAVWSANPLFENLAPGSYDVFIRDADVPACLTGVDGSPVLFSEPALLVITSEPTHITCFGSSSGAIEVAAEGGTGSYQYRLDAGLWQGDPVFGNLPAGDYLVQVRDAAGCTVSEPVTLTAPDEMIIQNIVPGDESCFGANDGNIEIFMSGGTPPYRYSSDGGATFQDERLFENLAPGTYSVVTEDALGCVVAYPGSIVIEAALEITLDMLNTDNVTCQGAADGGIVAVASGGAGGIEYSLDGITWQPDGIFADLDAGGHVLYIRDVEGCVITADFTLSEPDGIAFTVWHEDIECHGADDGIIHASVDSGIAPFIFRLFDASTGSEAAPEQASSLPVEFTGLAAGSYYIMVVDNNGCLSEASDNIIITQPDELMIDTVVAEDFSCHGANDGTITITITGGTGNKEYSIDGGLTFYTNGGLFTNLAQGTFDIAVRDENGCETAHPAGVTINDPPLIGLASSTVTNALCYGSLTGSISVTGTGGTGQLLYSLDNDSYQSAGIFNSLSAGAYTLYIKDGNNCIRVFSLPDVGQPDMLLVTAEVLNIECFGGAGIPAISASPTGGTSPYTLTLYQGGAPVETISGVATGGSAVFGSLTAGLTDYWVIADDASGCGPANSGMLSTVVPDEFLAGSISVTDAECYGVAGGTIEIGALGGTAPYLFSLYTQTDDWAGDIEIDGTAVFDQLFAGTYRVEIVDANGCGPVIASDIIIGEPGPFVAAASVVDAWCRDYSPDGSVELDVTGGTAPYSFIWSNGATTRDIGNIDAGEYDVQITDASGCEIIIEGITVGFEHSIGVTLPEEYLICHGEGVTLEAEADHTGLWIDYLWTSSDGVEPDEVASPWVNPLLPVTVYTVTVTDENNCRNDASVSVSRLGLQGISIGNDTVLLQGTTIELEAKGGDFINYEWTPSTGLSSVSGKHTTAMVMNDTEYFVYAETAEGCIESDSIFISIVRPVEPVSGFTPNGDGVNDLFEIPNAADYPNIEVEVFNRAGQRVFYSRGYSDDRLWDGTYNGRDLPMGTYYFVITLNDGFGTRPLTGPVTIVR